MPRHRGKAKRSGAKLQEILQNPVSIPRRDFHHSHHRFRVHPSSTIIRFVKSEGIALTDRSGAIAAGGTSQQVMADNSKRKYIFIQPLEEDSWINFGADAAALTPGSIKIAAGQAYVENGPVCPTQAINIVSATTSKKFTAKEG